MELTIFWLMVGAFICRASYIAEKRPVANCYRYIIEAHLAGDRKEQAWNIGALVFFVLLWPLTLYYYWCDKGDW